MKEDEIREGDSEFKVKAKDNVAILMIGGRYSNFVKDNIDRADCMIILDENRCGNSFEKDIFIKCFEDKREVQDNDNT